ncbi:MAG TPA: nucleotidyl transferase AbiEii/AbiGii toxin family protein [Armatimonadota bacterium]
MKRALIHGYDEPLTAAITTYLLDEIVAEKLRALLQTHAQLQARGWNRPRAHDYNDLWRILGTFRDEWNLIRIRQCLSAKCVARDVSYAGLDDLLLHYWSVKRIDPGRATLVPSCVIFPRVIKCFKNYVSAWRR